MITPRLPGHGLLSDHQRPFNPYAPVTLNHPVTMSFGGGPGPGPGGGGGSGGQGGGMFSPQPTDYGQGSLRDMWQRGLLASQQNLPGLLNQQGGNPQFFGSLPWGMNPGDIRSVMNDQLQRAMDQTPIDPHTQTPGGGDPDQNNHPPGGGIGDQNHPPSGGGRWLEGLGWVRYHPWGREVYKDGKWQPYG